MKEYHKIQTVFHRNPETKFKTVLYGKFSTPEFEYLVATPWVFTEKVDGTNIRIMYDNGNFEIRGRTDRAQLPAQLVARLGTLISDISPNFQEVMRGANQVCLYGEGYGAKIQKGGGNYRPDQDFVMFDIWVDGVWLQRDSVQEIGVKLGIDVVPIIGTGNLWDMIYKVQDGFNSQWGNFISEGIVARPEVELLDRLGRRIITKLKYNDFPR